MVDVKSKRCAHDGCAKRPSYGVAGSTKPEFCFDHKEGGMVDVINKRCDHDGCTKQAYCVVLPAAQSRSSAINTRRTAW